MIRVSAPGKMVLLGEYAVLFGAPAVVAAVDRRAVVEVERSAEWSVDAPGFADQAAVFDFSADGRLSWRDDLAGDRFRLVEGVLSGLHERSLIDKDAARFLRLDTREFFLAEGGHKLGLGSSAALTVALAVAVAAAAGGGEHSILDTGDRGLGPLVDLHRSFQGGRGSGVDVAASLFGGVVRYRAGGPSPPEAAPLELPPDLTVKAFWTGASASTGAFLETLERRRRDDAAEADKAISALDRRSRRGADALAQRDAGGFLDAVDGFWHGLDELGRAIRMPILSQPHRTLRRIAEEHGVSYKPSGAGGGDLGVGFSANPGPMDRMCCAARDVGLAPLDLEIDTTGVSLDPG